MNIFYYNDKTDMLQEEKPNLASCYYSEILTEKDFSKLYDDYIVAREQGNSIIDSIEMSK